MRIFVLQNMEYIPVKATVLDKYLIKPYFHGNEEILQINRGNSQYQLVRAIIMKDRVIGRSLHVFAETICVVRLKIN